MSTPQRSRYPRPLKAIRTFSGGGQQNGGENRLSGATSRSLSPSSTAGTGSSLCVESDCSGGVWTEASSPSRVYCQDDACVALTSADQLTPEGNYASQGKRSGCDGMDSKDCDLVGGHHPRRSNSLGSLADTGSYRNSTWPCLSVSTSQYEAEEEPLLGSRDEDSVFSHKRSNSCSSADRLKTAQPLGLKSAEVGPTHTRISVEGLNQEVSTALEGNPTRLFQTTPTDGRVAPVRDLLVHGSAGPQTPPTHTISSSHLSASAHSPRPLLSSPSSTSTSSSTQTDSHHQGTSNSSPAHLAHLPPSPKPSFAHEPPDGAERCTIKMDTYVQNEDLVLQGPDKSKGNIIFKGNVFAPLLV